MEVRPLTCCEGRDHISLSLCQPDTAKDPNSFGTKCGRTCVPKRSGADAEYPVEQKERMGTNA